MLVDGPRRRTPAVPSPGPALYPPQSRAGPCHSTLLLEGRLPSLSHCASFLSCTLPPPSQPKRSTAGEWGGRGLALVDAPFHVHTHPHGARPPDSTPQFSTL